MAKPLVTDDGWVEAVKNSWGTKKAKGPKSYQTTKQLNRKEFARCIRELEQLLMPEQVGKVGQSEVLSEAVDFLTKLGSELHTHGTRALFRHTGTRALRADRHTPAHMNTRAHRHTPAHIHTRAFHRHSTKA
eukprot:comp22591_c1_seq2/m.34612 comp22591_c1_seq2/g.34612  ORF comp22591_c1_seq2/g.34612 comp22591_c1_seq2/m.34612 type:complete len:132 (-) comp22591_c1_seq2:103-498(-)